MERRLRKYDIDTNVDSEAVCSSCSMVGVRSIWEVGCEDGMETIVDCSEGVASVSNYGRSTRNEVLVLVPCRAVNTEGTSSFRCVESVGMLIASLIRLKRLRH
jgi:hypothetical protein